MEKRAYIAIDLKSFYAFVECIERGLDPFTTNLVVADESRTTKTICLAASPAIKKYGVPGRARLFEVAQKIRDANYIRKIPHSVGCPCNPVRCLNQFIAGRRNIALIFMVHIEI